MANPVNNYIQYLKRKEELERTRKILNKRKIKQDNKNLREQRKQADAKYKDKKHAGQRKNFRRGVFNNKTINNNARREAYQAREAKINEARAHNKHIMLHI